MSRNHSAGKIRVGTSGIILSLLTITAVGALYPPTSQSQESIPDSCASSHLKDIEDEAKSGTAAAQKELADIYAQGRCVPKDYTKSAYWYGRSADQEDPEAQFQLGKYFLEGIGVSRDPGRAADWFRRAAEHKHHGAQYALGGLYSQGRGVPKDLIKSYEWVRISSPKLDTHTRDVLATLAKKMTPAQVEDAEKHAVEWITAHGETAE